MTSEQQISSLGETFLELLKRLDDGISSVIYLCSSMSRLDFCDFRFSTVQQRVRSASWITSCFSTGIYLPFYSQLLEWKTAEGRKRFYEEAGCCWWSTSFVSFFGSLQTAVQHFCNRSYTFHSFLVSQLKSLFVFFAFSRLEDMYYISSSFIHYKC